MVCVVRGGEGRGRRDRLCMCVLVTERDYRGHLL